MNTEHLPKEVISKIEKLMNLEKGAREIGSLAEAENAAMRLQEILMKHNLDSVSGINFNKVPQIQQAIIETSMLTKKNESQWLITLYGGVAMGNLCRIIIINGKRNKATKAFVDDIMIFGSPENIEIVKYSVEQLASKIRQLGKQYWARYEQDSWKLEKPETRNTYLRGFYIGAALGIQEKLKTNNEVIKNSDTKMEGLMVVHNNAVDQHIQKHIGPLKIRQGPALMGKNGLDQGKEVGKGLGVNKGVGPNSKTINLLGN